ncbi:unnamed protein product [Arabis nemorensis]|uniref:Uncharacterized protein n=1 Tax=Arabis nemorensis TaxID=586526 RepID=A0A565BTW1_9BRAS|nr:unnamed protein product [Arabis nemorensis]
MKRKANLSEDVDAGVLPDKRKVRRATAQSGKNADGSSEVNAEVDGSLNLSPSEPTPNSCSRDDAMRSQLKHDEETLVELSLASLPEGDNQEQSIETTDSEPRNESEELVSKGAQRQEISEEEEAAGLDQELQDPVILGKPVNLERKEGSTSSLPSPSRSVQ